MVLLSKILSLRDDLVRSANTHGSKHSDSAHTVGVNHLIQILTWLTAAIIVGLEWKLTD